MSLTNHISINVMCPSCKTDRLHHHVIVIPGFAVLGDAERSDTNCVELWIPEFRWISAGNNGRYRKFDTYTVRESFPVDFPFTYRSNRQRQLWLKADKGVSLLFSSAREFFFFLS